MSSFQHPVATSLSRRGLLRAGAGAAGLSLPQILGLQQKSQAAGSEKERSPGRAKRCIIVYCWGGTSHHETWDPKPDAPVEIRGEFAPIPTATPGIQLGEHMPKIARHTGKLAIVRSVHHDDSAHGRGMYWNLTGHKPPRSGNIAPKREDWPSLTAVISKFRPSPAGRPPAVRLPYPMVDNGTLQAGEYGGWLGAKYDAVVMRPQTGTPFGGVSRSLGAEVLKLNEVDQPRLSRRAELLRKLDKPPATEEAFEGFDHFRHMAKDMLLGSEVKNAYDLQREDPRIREMYGEHIGGTSMLLARRLTEAGIPVVQVCCAAGDLNGSVGDMWDTHADNFNRLKKKLLPVFDQGLSALLEDLHQRGTLDETLVVVLTDFGRTPRVNKAAGRDHYPNVYSVAFAGGGIQGGQVYGASDGKGAFPHANACTPADLHATIFRAMGISPRAEIHDPLGRPFPISDGNVLPLF